MASSVQPAVTSHTDLSAIASIFAAHTGELIHRHLLGELKRDDEIDSIIKDILEEPADERCPGASIDHRPPANNVNSSRLPVKESAGPLYRFLNFKSTRPSASVTIEQANQLPNPASENDQNQNIGNTPVRQTHRQSPSPSTSTLVVPEASNSTSPVVHLSVPGAGSVTTDTNTLSDCPTPPPDLESNETVKLLDKIKQIYQKRKEMDAKCYLHRIKRGSSNAPDPQSASRNYEIRGLNGSLRSYVQTAATRLGNRLTNKTYMTPIFLSN